MKMAVFAVLLLAALASADKIGVVVQYDDSVYETVCVEFSGDVTAEQALNMGGFSPEIYQDPNWGAGLCGINGVGCPASTCFSCGFSEYWGFSYRKNGAWQYSGVGISYLDDNGYRMVHDGGVLAFRWGPFGSSIIDKGFADICVTQGATPQRVTGRDDAPKKLWLRLPNGVGNVSEWSAGMELVTSTFEGSVVPFAEVHAAKIGGPFKYSDNYVLVSDGDGKIALDVPPGRYLIQLLMPNYLPFIREVDVSEIASVERLVEDAPGESVGEVADGEILVENAPEESAHSLAPVINTVTQKVDVVYDDETGWESSGWLETLWDGWRPR